MESAPYAARGQAFSHLLRRRAVIVTSSTEHLPHLDTLQRTCTKLATAEDDRFTVGKVHDALHQLLKEAEDDDELRALAVAFGYVMNNSKGYRSILDDAEDGQPVSEGPFGPMFESQWS